MAKKRTRGRPALPKGKAREIILQIRLTRDEHKALKRAANGDVSKWSRAVLLRAADRS
jgi:hypothetical protein